MLKRILAFSLFIASYSVLNAQIQNGLVVVQNSGKKPLPQVSFVVVDAAPTTSDQAGKFALEVPNHAKGQRLLVEEIAYKDWMVVNEHMIEQWVYAPKKVYRVDMCPRQLYVTRVEQLYEIGRASAEKEFQKVVDQIRKLQQLGKLNHEQYLARYQEAQDNLFASRRMLDKYIPQLVAVNTDYLTPFERNAQELVSKGQLTKAIQIYENLALEKRMKDYMQQEKAYNEELENMIPMLERFAQTLILRGGKANYEKATTFMKGIADCNPNHFKRNFDFAVLLYLQNNLDEALKYFERSLKNTSNEFYRVEIYTKIAGVYQDLGKFELAVKTYDTASTILATLPRNLLSTAELMINYDINFATCLIQMNEYYDKNDKEAYKFAMKLLKNAENILTNAGSRYGKNYLRTLMMCYHNMIPVCRFLNDTDELERIQKKLEQLESDTMNDEELLSVSISKCQIAKESGNQELALSYLKKSATIVEKLYNTNPERFKIYLLHVYENLGGQLYDMDRYDEANVAFLRAVNVYESMEQNLKEGNEMLYYNVLYMLSQSYYYNRQFSEILPLYPKIAPIMKVKSQSADIGVMYAYISACSYLGRQEWAEDIDFIMNRLYEYREDEVYKSHVQACYSTLSVLYMNSGKHDLAEKLLSLSDDLARMNQHKIMLSYNKLNRMPSLLMQGKSDEVLAQVPTLIRELKRRNGDDESILLVRYYAFLAYLREKDWDSAKEIYPFIDYTKIVSSKSEQCNCILAQMAYRLHLQQPIDDLQTALKRISIDVQKESPYAYLNLVCDYHLLLMQTYMNLGDYSASMSGYLQLLESLQTFYNQKPAKAFLPMAYFFYLSSEILSFNKKYDKSIESLELAVAFYNKHNIDNKAVGSDCFYWISSVITDGMREAEVNFRYGGEENVALLHLVKKMTEKLFQHDPKLAEGFKNVLKNRRIPNTDKFYLEELK